LSVEEIGWDRLSGRFVDDRLRFIRSCFKLYPWERLARAVALSAATVLAPTAGEFDAAAYAELLPRVTVEPHVPAP
uniref:glutathionylspermidine synthase family protein n=1 Tax=Streptomyces sp. EN27 TaxID=211464 RepID=UPI000AF8470A